MESLPNCNRGGVNQGLLDRVASLESELAELKQKKSSATGYGLSMISDSASVTVDDGLVLSAKEKNAAVDGSIMQKIEQIRNMLLWSRRDFTEKSNVKEESGKRIVTYSMDFSGCSELCMNIYARAYSPMFYKTFPLVMNGMIENLYVVDNHGFTWAGNLTVNVSKNEIALHTYKNSTNIDSNYFQLVAAWTR